MDFKEFTEFASRLGIETDFENSDCVVYKNKNGRFVFWDDGDITFTTRSGETRTTLAEGRTEAEMKNFLLGIYVEEKINDRYLSN